MDHGPLNSLSDVLEYDTEARRLAARWIAARE
jgi:hypothetical protein